MSTPDSAELAERLEFAVAIAREAGQSTLELFQSAAVQVATKGDGTPVTEADRAAERLLRERIQSRYPADGIVGEEEATLEGTSGYDWILDPIDGTRSFVHGVPLYGTLVGMERDGEAVLGVIEHPALDERVFAARGLGATWQRAGRTRPARVSTTANLKDALVCFTSPQLFPKIGRQGLLRRLESDAGVLRGWSDCYAHLLVATGRADAVVEPVMAVWDCAALLPVLEEAGGTFTDLDGERTIRGQGALATNGVLKDSLLALTHAD